MSETVTHLTRSETGTDRYGKPTFRDVAIPVDGVGVSPAQSTLDPQTGLTVTTSGYTLYLPPDVTAQAGDRFTVRGKTFKVRGDSQNWASYFSTWTPGNVVLLETAEIVDP